MSPSGIPFALFGGLLIWLFFFLPDFLGVLSLVLGTISCCLSLPYTFLDSDRRRDSEANPQ